MLPPDYEVAIQRDRVKNTEKFLQVVRSDREENFNKIKVLQAELQDLRKQKQHLKEEADVILLSSYEYVANRIQYLEAAVSEYLERNDRLKGSEMVAADDLRREKARLEALEAQSAAGCLVLRFPDDR